MKIGIITMHRVLNIGSVLQAYATQKAFEKLGYDSELIDYMYISKTKTSIKSKILSFGLNVLLGFPKQKRKKRLTAFYNRYAQRRRIIGIRFNENRLYTISIVPAATKYGILVM